MSTCLRFLALATLLAPPIAWAQDAPAPDPAHRAKAEALLQVLDMEKMMNGTVKEMLDAQEQAQPDLAQYRDVMEEFLNTYISYAALREDILGIYMDAFTAPELQDLIAFYQTPTGQKAREKMPELLRKSGQLGAMRVQQHLPELQQKLMAREAEMNAEQAPAEAPNSGADAAAVTQEVDGAKAPAE